MKLFSQITEALAQADAANLEKSKEWALRKLEQLKAYKIENHRKWNYEEMFSICGGKTWYAEMSDGQTSLIAFVEKNAKRNAEKRNAKIAAQLEKAGVTDVFSGQIVWNKDGFDGNFAVETNQGTKHVRIESVYAGGYNVQCFHVRVLVKIK